MNQEEQAALHKQLIAASASIDASLAQIVLTLDALGIPEELLKRMAPPEFWEQLDRFRARGKK